MSRTDDRRDDPLPVTAEVGGEGGSYADPTMQVSTFAGPGEGLPRGPGSGGPSSVATQAIHRETIAGGGMSADSDRGMVRYPTEPPTPPSATEGRRFGRVDWRTAAIGAVVGATVTLLARRR